MKLLIVTVILATVAIVNCADAPPSDVELIEPTNSAAIETAADGPKPSDGDKRTAKRGAYLGIGVGYGYGSYYGGYYPYYGHYYDHYYPHYGYGYGYGYGYPWGGYYW